MWAIDLTHTSHTRAQTGIQQVCRSILGELDKLNLYFPVVYDRYSGNWRSLDKDENSCLKMDTEDPSSQRSSRWTWRQRLKGRISNILGKETSLAEASGIFCPEIIDTFRMNSLFADEWTKAIPKVALFHDLIPIKHPEWCPSKTVEHFPGYLECLSRFDHVICVSKASQSDILEYWHSRQLSAPETSVVPLGIPAARQVVNLAEKKRHGPVLNVLSVGTLEARKNHLNLLKAAEELWQKDLKFQLTLVGMINKSSGKEAAELVGRLQKKGRSLSWKGPVSEDDLNKFYATADLFAYPSFYEGFGIPVLEALKFELPVLTTAFGALAELVDGGGCVTCDGSSESIRDALENLITDESFRTGLVHQARNRSIRNFEETAMEISSILQDVAESRKL